MGRERLRTPGIVRAYRQRRCLILKVRGVRTRGRGFTI